MNYNAIMRIPRFYCPDISSDVLEIHDQKIIHHLIKVLRARQGQRVVLFDGRIPHVARAVETDKFRVSLVFKGTTDKIKKEEEPVRDTSKDPFKGTSIEGKD